MTEPYSVWTQDLPLILASKSRIRQELLQRAGLNPDIGTPNFDERSFEAVLRREALPIHERASALAKEKARLASLVFADHYVVGADQMLTCDGIILHKSVDLSEAKRQLAFLSNRSHQLTSAVAVAQNGSILFDHTDTADMTMRAMTSDQIDSYCAIAGDALYQSVGCYRLEGLGVHLFDRIQGDFFTVLGIPLEPLIGFLRREGCLSL